MAANDTAPAQGESAEAVSDEGVEFAGLGGMSWAWIGTMIDDAIQTQHDVAEQRQRARGADPCVYWASIDELWATNHGPAWWRATTTAAKVSDALSRAIEESIRARGRTANASGQTPLADFLVQQLGADSLIPDVTKAELFLVGLLTQGFTLGALPFEVAAIIENYLPLGSDLLRTGVYSRQDKGLEISPGIYLWGPGLPANPTNETQNALIRRRGRYSGRLISDQIREWKERQVDRVVPARFGTARARLINLVGSWEGSGEYGVWVPSDGYAETSRIGFLLDWRETFFAERAVARDLCRSYEQSVQDRLDLGAELPGNIAKGAFVLGMAGIAAWLWGK